MANLRGYIFSRAFAGQRIPQHVQNLVIRDYCQRNGHTYLLSAAEYAMHGSYLMLETLIEGLDGLDGFVAYSLSQLPEESQRRTNFLQRIVQKGKALHFAVENMAIQHAGDIERVETLLRLQQVLSTCPKEIPFFENA